MLGEAFGVGQVIFVCIAVFTWRAFERKSWANLILSYIINQYLLWRYHIKSVDGRQPIPTLPYQFPDGKGSTKFLNGESASIKWAKQYGPIYRIWTGLTPEIILTRPSDVKTVYRDSDTHFKAKNANAGWVLGELIGDGVGMQSSSEWKRIHAVVGPPLSQKATTYVSLAMSRIESGFAILEQRCGQNQSVPLHLKPTEDVNLIAFWVYCDVMYGQLPDKAMNEELLQLIDLRDDIWSYTFKGGWSQFSIQKHWMPAVRKKIHEFDQRWDIFNDLVYQHLLASGTKTAPPILALREAMQEGRVKRSEVMHSVSEAIFTNIEVTTGSFAWILLLLAAHPEIQSELRQEMTEARQKGTPEDWNQYLASHSTLLTYCIWESARLRPIANYTYPQYLPTDRAVGGYLIPRGTYIIVDANALNRRDAAWGPDADQFRPRRYMGKPASEFRYRLWRFGFGPRQCPAQPLADTMLKCLVAHVLGKYRVSIPEVLVNGEEWRHRKPDTWFSMAANGVLCEEI
ncbi:putative cytochrome P450 monooxygenase [Aspergillus unguis]